MYLFHSFQQNHSVSIIKTTILIHAVQKSLRTSRGITRKIIKIFYVVLCDVSSNQCNRENEVGLKNPEQPFLNSLNKLVQDVASITLPPAIPPQLSLKQYIVIIITMSDTSQFCATLKGSFYICTFSAESFNAENTRTNLLLLFG